jgi:hypothetical protein
MIQGVESKASVDGEICSLDISLTRESLRIFTEQKCRYFTIAECLDRPGINVLRRSILNLRKPLSAGLSVKMTAP